MSNNKEQQLVTLPLNDLIWNILGDYLQGLDKAPVTPITAMVLEQYLKDSVRHRVIFDDIDGNRLKYPILWRYPDWYNSNEKYYKQKKWAEKERIERWIKDKNIDNLAAAISKSSGMKLSDAIPFAQKMMSKKVPMEVLQTLGLYKLIEKEEEL